MRLTIYHDPQILPQWQDSLSKLLAADGLTRARLPSGHHHLAIFNDRVVGLAVSQGEQLIYLSVRDLTRRRGVGHYLLGETLAWQRQQGETCAWLSQCGLTHAALASLAPFLLAEGFQRQADRWLRVL